ncbi:DUF559 domain-containing protein [Nocardioides sp. JQ2195]|uniref:DUF559 domain-containing protein n=1 Tax=Nocardioides sp. JQ2195 TaxID=2592334 RepID=UPI00143E6E9C|nr:DUF559 domain-containing protein [Nocardioides sp. JQ2195]QIX25594.1 DUF559 domain-containing protein [Nocardioides sp. JQ2195]
MDALTALHRCGGTAGWRELARFTSRRQLAKALRSGVIEKRRHGQYAVPFAGQPAAEALCGVLSGLSAARHWDLKLKFEPERPWVTVRAHSRVSRDRREGVEVHWDDLPDEDVVEGVTSLARTVADCARWLPFDEAVSIADSALRSGRVSRQRLDEVADRMPRTGRSRALAVVAFADGRAANPFESTLRVICSQVAGLRAAPQVSIGPHRVDLADSELGLVIEAESFAFHGSVELFRADVRRYTWLATQRWVVARFLWEDVMYKPERVKRDLERLVEIHRSCGCRAVI